MSKTEQSQGAAREAADKAIQLALQGYEPETFLDEIQIDALRKIYDAGYQAALSPPDQSVDREAMPDLRDVIERALRDYRMQYTVDDDGGDGLALEDVLTPPLEDTVENGLKEICNLADYLSAVIPDAREQINAATQGKHGDLTIYLSYETGEKDGRQAERREVAKELRELKHDNEWQNEETCEICKYIEKLEGGLSNETGETK